MIRPILNDFDRSVYQLVCEAARAGAHTPTQQEMATVLCVAGYDCCATSVSVAIRRIDAAGMIKILGPRSRRIYQITRTKHFTAPAPRVFPQMKTEEEREAARERGRQYLATRNDAPRPNKATRRQFDEALSAHLAMTPWSAMESGERPGPIDHGLSSRGNRRNQIRSSVGSAAAMCEAA